MREWLWGKNDLVISNFSAGDSGGWQKKISCSNGCRVSPTANRQ